MMRKDEKNLTPNGWPRVLPRIVVRDPDALVVFIKRVFDASGEIPPDGPAQLMIGDSVIMVSGSGARPEAHAFLYVYVEDADATYERAVAAGALTLEAPLDTPYGDRRAMVEDPFGNVWQIARHGGTDAAR